MSPRVKHQVEDLPFEVTARDAFMARLAAGRQAAQDAVNALDEAIAYCVNPDEDESGKKREDLVDAALEALGTASRAIEEAEDVREYVDPSEGEPWDGDEDEDDEDGDEEQDDEDDEDEDEDDRIPRATARVRRRR